MRRVPELHESDRSDRQRKIAHEIAGARAGVLGGPFLIWLNVPDIAEPVNALSDRLRKNSKLEKRLVELLVLVIAHDWNAAYAWTMHAHQAAAAGLDPAIVEAIRTGAEPTFEHDDERTVYDIFTQLTRSKSLAEGLYARGLEIFGLDLMIELVTTAGLYTMISMMLVAFDVPAPEGRAAAS